MGFPSGGRRRQWPTITQTLHHLVVGTKKPKLDVILMDSRSVSCAALITIATIMPTPIYKSQIQDGLV